MPVAWSLDRKALSKLWAWYAKRSPLLVSLATGRSVCCLLLGEWSLEASPFSGQGAASNAWEPMIKEKRPQAIPARGRVEIISQRLATLSPNLQATQRVATCI